MSSLRQILAEHAPVVVIDAASSRIQVGWLPGDAGLPLWESSTAEAGIGVFECLEKLKIHPDKANAFIFCEGPGSILGIRTSAITIRTWNVAKERPVFAFQSLRIVGEALGRTDVTVIADARRDAWHTFVAGSKLERVATQQLSGSLITPDGFRNWTPLPTGVVHAGYIVGELLNALMDADIFRESAEPDAFLHEEPSYAKWSPQIHRAP